MSVTSMLPSLPEQEEWRELAACTGRHDVVFFPAPGESGAVAAAKALCAACPVRLECLAYAMETGQPDGVWGGHTPRERSGLRRRLSRALREATG